MKKIHTVTLFASLWLLFFARNVSAQVFFNEIQISPTGERFIELYNSDGANVDLTGWYIQRKTATGNSFGSLVTSTQFKDKSIKANGYFIISRGQIANSDITVDPFPLTESNTIRIRDSKGADADQITWTIIDGGKSYQKTPNSEWTINTPTPGASNNNNSPQNGVFPQSSSGISTQSSSSLPSLSNFPVEPQIIATAGATNRTILAGALIVFSGKAFGLKKEPIENARMVWSFGDGGNAEGQSVSHVYYYPGEYVVVLDASSGFYSASARVRVTVSVPQLMLRTGGDHTHSFVSIENQGDNEIDLSAWKIHTQDKDFIFPQNTVLGARKIISFPSEVTGLVTPLGTSVSLHFPNGTLVPLHHENTPPHTGEISLKVPSEKMISKQSFPVLPRINNPQVLGQIASVIEALPDTSFKSNTISSVKKEGRLWLWYLGVGALGALAFVGVRFSRIWAKTDIADEYEIIEEKEKEESAHEVTRARDTLPF